MNKFMAKSQCDRCGENVATDLGVEALVKQDLDSLPSGWAEVKVRGSNKATHLCGGCAKRAITPQEKA